MTSANQQILLELEKLMSDFGPWVEKTVLGGGVALIVYDQCLAKSNAQPVGTTDMDFLIPRRLVVPASIKPLSEILKSHGFAHRFKNTGTPPIESYFKESGDLSLRWSRSYKLCKN